MVFLTWSHIRSGTDSWIILNANLTVCQIVSSCTCWTGRHVSFWISNSTNVNNYTHTHREMSCFVWLLWVDVAFCLNHLHWTCDRQDHPTTKATHLRAVEKPHQDIHLGWNQNSECKNRWQRRITTRTGKLCFLHNINNIMILVLHQFRDPNWKHKFCEFIIWTLVLHHLNSHLEMRGSGCFRECTRSWHQEGMAESSDRARESAVAGFRRIESWLCSTILTRILGTSRPAQRCISYDWCVVFDES